MIWWVVGIIVALGLLSIPVGMAWGSAKPRLEARKEKRQLEVKKTQERKDREKILDQAVQKLADHDVRSAQSNMPSNMDIFSYLPRGYAKEDLAPTDFDFINEQYLKHTDEETNKQIGIRVIESELSDFEKLRQRRKKEIQQLESAREEIMLDRNKDEHEDDFAQLEIDNKRAGR